MKILSKIQSPLLEKSERIKKQSKILSLLNIQKKVNLNLLSGQILDIKIPTIKHDTNRLPALSEYKKIFSEMEAYFNKGNKFYEYNNNNIANQITDSITFNKSNENTSIDIMNYFTEVNVFSYSSSPLVISQNVETTISTIEQNRTDPLSEIEKKYVALSVSYYKKNASQVQKELESVKSLEQKYNIQLNDSNINSLARTIQFSEDPVGAIEFNLESNSKFQQYANYTLSEKEQNILFRNSYWGPWVNGKPEYSFEEVGKNLEKIRELSTKFNGLTTTEEKYIFNLNINIDILENKSIDELVQKIEEKRSFENEYGKLNETEEMFLLRYNNSEKKALMGELKKNGYDLTLEQDSYIFRTTDDIETIRAKFESLNDIKVIYGDLSYQEQRFILESNKSKSDISERIQLSHTIKDSYYLSGYGEYDMIWGTASYENILNNINAYTFL